MVFNAFSSQKSTLGTFHHPYTPPWCHSHENNAIWWWGTPPATLCQILKQIGPTVPEIMQLLYHPSPKISPTWPLSAPDHPAPETWPQIQCHSNSSPSLPQATADTIASCTDSQDSINKPAHLWLELPRCIPFLLHILPYPGELAPPQLHTARHRGPPQVCFCSPGHQIPRNACTMDANWQQRGTESNQG